MKMLTKNLWLHRLALAVTAVTIMMPGSEAQATPTTFTPPVSEQSTKELKCQGIVKDAKGEPLIGATVLIQGTTTGTITDYDGNFLLSVKKGATIIVSSIGFRPQKIKITNSQPLRIILVEDTQRLEEVVVVGYNQVKKGQLTGSMKIVDGKELEYMSSPSLENRLQGKTAGVMISTGSGQPGSSNMSIRVRGTGSINGGNTPLYIMDGVMVEPAQFAALNNNDIEDLQVLKDASATAIYGSRGANGVIVITTKKGKAGKTRVNYRAQVGVAKDRNYLDMMNGPENIQYQLQCALSDQSSTMYPLMGALRRENNGEANPADERRLANARATNTDWIGLMTRTGFLMDHSLSISGGNNKTKFYISGSYLKQAGTLEGADIERYSGRFNIDHKAKSWLQVGLKASAGYSEIGYADPAGSNNRLSWMNPWFTALLAYPYEKSEGWDNKDNPTLISKYVDQRKHNLKAVWSAYAKVNILPWLSAKTSFGMDYMYERGETVVDRRHPTSQGNKGSFSQSSSQIARYTWTNTLNAVHDFENGHSISAVLGMEMFNGQYYGFGFSGYDVNPNMMDSPAGIGDKIGASNNPPSINGGATRSNLLSYFSQVGYDINRKYNFSASLRYDTSSKFHGDNKSALFWSVGAGWILSSEDFLKDVTWLNRLKLRASYGTTGNQDGIGDFTTYDGYSNISYGGNAGYVHSQLGNSHLKWETSAQFNTGVDFSLFKNRLKGTLDYYYIKTKDLFMNKQISSTSGFGSINTNAGSISNTGIEVSLDYALVDTKDFGINLGMNFTWNKNEVLDLGIWSNKEGKFQSGYQVYEEGRPLRTWNMNKWAGVNPETGLVQFLDKDGNKTTDESQAVYYSDMGSPEIPYFGGFNTSLRYKGLSLTADFTYALDYTIMNAGRWFIDNHNFNGNKPKYMLNMWMKPGDKTEIPRFLSGTQPSPMASQFLEDASYLRLKTVRLNYLLPKSILKKLKVFESVSCYIQGENLALWTSYKGADPEVNGDLDYLSYPKPINITLGVDINF